MNVDQFYLILPSNSSMQYFPENTTTNFITQLPHEIRLQGQWVVALTEIQLPRTFLHVRHDDSFENRISILTSGGIGFDYPKYDGNSKNRVAIEQGDDLLYKYPVPEDNVEAAETIESDEKYRPLVRLDLLYNAEAAETIESGEKYKKFVGSWHKPLVSFFEPGIYTDIENLINNLNNTPDLDYHVKFTYDKLKSNYVRVHKNVQNSVRKMVNIFWYLVIN